ncbi:transposase [Microcystis aeruginosa PCC 9701]|jgi:transposase|uniref:Transposase n=1 Tax=Microcystis aeruginosa PCC 9701 TaxID=721123 RepID=I4IMR8_MICAE|nr:transposase [Microcystis aeruginosa PCC 9701]
MRPYSVDFRQKIIDVWEKEKISIRELAKRFNVAKSFIQKLLKQYQETGDIRPRPQGGSPPSKLNSEQLVILVEIIEANRDATLQELSNLLYEKTEIKVSRATLGRITKKLNQSFPKKFHRSPRKLAKK